MGFYNQWKGNIERASKFEVLESLSNFLTELAEDDRSNRDVSQASLFLRHIILSVQVRADGSADFQKLRINDILNNVSPVYFGPEAATSFNKMVEYKAITGAVEYPTSVSHLRDVADYDKDKRLIQE